MQRKEWAVFFLIHTKEADAIHVKNIFSDIQKFGVSKKVNLHICLSTTKRGIAVIDPVQNNVQKVDDENFDGYLYTFNQSNANEQNFNLRQSLIFPQFDISRKSDVIEFLMRVKNRRIEKKIMVVTWDHGSAIGIFRQALPGSENAVDPVFGRDYKMLTNVDLNTIFKKVFKNKKVDILLMMNCFMNFFDFGFTLKNSVRILIAPENFISNTGFDYHYFFKKLHDCPSVGVEQLSSMIVKKQNEIQPNRSDPALMQFFETLIVANNEDIILLANRLDKYMEFANLLDKLIINLTYLIQTNQISSASIINCKEKSVIISNGRLFNLVDFGSLLIQLKYLSKDKKFEAICKRLFKLLKEIVIKKYLGTKVQLNHENAILDHTAFSIYFPTVSVPDILPTSSGFKDFIQETSLHATYFSKNHLWDNFLLLLFKNKRIS